MGIIGESGSGKTTLGLVIAGLYTNIKGSLWVLDSKLGAENCRVCYIAANSHIFHMTLYENICLWRKDVGKDSISNALRSVGLSRMATESFLDIDLSNNGSTLSGGEAQRVAISRALVRPYDIYIWDEPTASLDVDSQRYIEKVITELIPHEAIQILITHDPKMLKTVDRVFMLSNGRLSNMT